jgi:hypothetical protein
VTDEEQKAVQAAIDTSSTDRKAGPSDAIIAVMHQMAEHGRFAEMCEAGKAYFAQHHAARRFIAAKVPAMVMNRYPTFREIAGTEHLYSWQAAHPEHAAKLSEAFLSGRLPSIVEWTLESLRAAAA